MLFAVLAPQILLAPTASAQEANGWAVAPPGLTLEGAHLLDSAAAVAFACQVVQGLRPARDRHECRVEGFSRGDNSYAIRLLELGQSGSAPDPFARSIVEIRAGVDTVTVTRLAEP